MAEKISNHHSRQHITTIPFNQNSRNISKLKSNIRIVHIIAPEIIQTDVKNFRNIVQKLTGKPTSNKKKLKISTSAHSNIPMHLQIDDKIEKEKQEVKCEDRWINMEGSPSYLSTYVDEDDGEIEGYLSAFDLSSFFNQC